MKKLWGVCAASAALTASVLVPALPAAATAQATAQASTSPLIVHTTGGWVKGARSGGVDSFLGIPYAAPPVGALRWQAPAPVKKWTGVRTATQYGNRCPALASTNGPRSDTENCLFVNVQRPSGTESGNHLPVYVFIHGGGLVNGSSTQMNGNQFVQRTNAIVVTFNYRLGVFGFLGLPGMKNTKGVGNFGFMDQQAAMRWIRNNVTAFGGNPAQVTVGGESAGGWSVCGQLTAPASRGLFARAMLESGSCYSRTLAQTEANSVSYAAAAGCTDRSHLMACLRAIPERKLLDASTAFSPTFTSGTSVFPVSPAQAVAAGRFDRVPVVNGSNRDEGRTFAAGFIGAGKQQYVDFVTSTFGANAGAVLAHYPWPAKSDKFTAAYLAGAVFTDSGVLTGIGGCGALSLDETLARYTQIYAYEFDARHGPGLVPIPGYVWGAGHAAELAYLFPSFNNGTPIAATFNGAERELSRDMTHYWGGFVFHGRPEFQGQTNWPRFDLTGRIMSLRPGGRSQPISTAAFRSEHKCSFWDSLSH